MASLNKTLYQWLRIASPKQKQALARAAKTSVQQLGHLAYGRRFASAQLAQSLASASKRFTNKELHLDQRDICGACARCPLTSPRTKAKAA